MAVTQCMLAAVDWFGAKADLHTSLHAHLLQQLHALMR